MREGKHVKSRGTVTSKCSSIDDGKRIKFTCITKSVGENKSSLCICVVDLQDNFLLILPIKLRQKNV